MGIHGFQGGSSLVEWKAELKGKWDMEIETGAATFCFLIGNEKGVYPVYRGYMGCSRKLWAPFGYILFYVT